LLSIVTTKQILSYFDLSNVIFFFFGGSILCYRTN
jgi:hypothetical protein